jgi:iron complex outermembrane receptor protein
MAALLCSLVAAPTAAQQVAAPEPAGSENPATEAITEQDPEIVVSVEMARGRVVGEIPPEIQLNPADIRAVGASSIADLLQELGPQVRSGRGRGGDAPVVLINGKRVSGFAEIRNLPPEALLRVDVLPEEVALKYGFRADQRVINFVLRERFRAVTTELELGGPTAGGRTSVEADTNFLRIRDGNRLFVEAEYNFDSLLRESDRDIIQPDATLPFALAGNVTSASGTGSIDSRLDALVGTSVTVAGVPAKAAIAAPALTDFVATANAPNRTDNSQFRSLLAENHALNLGATYATSLGNIAATITAGLEATDSTSHLGLPTASLAVPTGNPFSPFADGVLVNRYAAGPLLRASESWTGRVGTAINGTAGDIGAGWAKGWNWSLVANYSHTASETITERGLDLAAVQSRLNAGDPATNPFGVTTLDVARLQDLATSNSDNVESSLVVNGGLLPLPTGTLTASLRAGGQHRQLTSESRRGNLLLRVDLARTQGNFQGSFDLPLTSVRNDVLAFAGDLSANLNIGIDTLSDFGTLTTWGYGLVWKPVPGIELLASGTNEAGAPTIQQLGDPLVATPNVRVFDFVRGETVDITRLDGGNRALVADGRRVWKLGLTVKPIDVADLTLTANFIDSRTDNSIAAFPTATAELEAAFPDRFRRDADGRLTQIDNRPVNFQQSNRQELRWGLNFSQALPASKAEIAAAESRRAAFAARRAAGEAAPAGGPPGRPPGAGGGPPPGSRRPGGFGGGGGGFRGLDGRFQLSIFHTWRFEESILIRDGVPELDLLNGSATGSRGGQPRHLVELRAGVGKSGLGARLGVNWQSGTRVLVDPSGATTSPDDLFFSRLATANLRLFADLGQRPGVARRIPFLRGARLSLSIDNLTNQKIDVRDRNGATPLGFQQDLLDPLGRTVTLSFRKLFF